MSDFSPRRALVVSFTVLLVAGAAFAVQPSARYDARMVYDPTTTHSVLFGGITAVDAGTKLAFEFDDTWDWNGVRWTQLFPLNRPTARYGHAMVWDSKRNRVVLFGGRTGNNKSDLNDTWVYQNGDWRQLQPPTTPPARVLGGATYDAARDRIVLFGGSQISADLKTVTHLNDTWEFDGTTWAEVIHDGPKLDKPLLAYDPSRDRTTMLGVDSSFGSHQYAYDPAAPAWKEVTNVAIPTCANEGAMVFQSHNNSLFYTGGFCSNSTSVEDNLEFDGEKWNPITVKISVGRVYGQAMAYDASRQTTILFGGIPVGSFVPRNEVWLYHGADWAPALLDNDSPHARSLFVFRTDPNAGLIYLFGGLDPTGDFADLWKYQYGRWEQIVADNGPTGTCITPTGVFDTSRNLLSVTCADSSTYEWNGTAWKPVADVKHVPPARRFSSEVYDQNLKKIVLFGGYGNNYIDETWLWDGVDWSQARRDLPPPRALAAMWFDPVLNRTVIFGGIGRLSTQDRITRFNDMWSFDGTTWTEIKPATLPPPRYGAQVAVDPRTNTVLLFGGLRLDKIETPGAEGKPPTITEVQVYADDFWQWDGHDWKPVTFPRVPYARENGGMAFDPSLNTMVIFGGFARGGYFSDLWTLTESSGWLPVMRNVFRRRPGGR